MLRKVLFSQRGRLLFGKKTRVGHGQLESVERITAQFPGFRKVVFTGPTESDAMKQIQAAAGHGINAFKENLQKISYVAAELEAVDAKLKK